MNDPRMEAINLRNKEIDEAERRLTANELVYDRWSGKMLTDEEINDRLNLIGAIRCFLQKPTEPVACNACGVQLEDAPHHLWLVVTEGKCLV